MCTVDCIQLFCENMEDYTFCEYNLGKGYGTYAIIDGERIYADEENEGMRGQAEDEPEPKCIGISIPKDVNYFNVITQLTDFLDSYINEINDLDRLPFDGMSIGSRELDTVIYFPALLVE